MLFEKCPPYNSVRRDLVYRDGYGCLLDTEEDVATVAEDPARLSVLTSLPAFTDVSAPVFKPVFVAELIEPLPAWPLACEEAATLVPALTFVLLTSSLVVETAF